MPEKSHVFTRHACLPHLELRTTTASSDCYQTHTHHEYSFGCIDAGHAVYHYGEHTTALQAGMTVMMPPGLAHACNPSTEQTWSYRMLYVAPQWVHHSFFPFDTHAWVPKLDLARYYSDDPAVFQSLATILEHLLGTPDPLQVEEQLLQFLEQYVLTPKGLVPNHSNHDHGLSRVRDLLHAHVEQALTLEELTKVCDMSGFALIRKFKQLYGQTPHAYHIDLRLNMAKDLLKQGVSLTDIAHQLGFSDQSHFQRQFKNRHATTPLNYVGAHRKKPIYD